MHLSLDQRRLLGVFLRSQREKRRGRDFGLASRETRRRTPGLRREEVADLCGMSPTWYAWIEQGRDISVSVQALARLADALRLSPAERVYLFELAEGRDPATVNVARALPDQDPADILQPALDATAGPAYLLDEGWRARAWNAPAARLFEDWFGLEGRCLLDYMFLDPRSRRLVPDWDERARRLAAEFRADTGRRPGSAAVQAMVVRLREGSADFAAFWADHSVLGREGGPRLFDHPGLGRLRFIQVNLHPAAWPDHRLVMLVPDARSTPAVDNG